MKNMIEKIMVNRRDGRLNVSNFKQKVAELVVSNIAGMLHINNVPTIEMMENKYNGEKGSYNDFYKIIKINEDLLGGFNMAFNMILLEKEDYAVDWFAKSIETLCHEMRHAWQHEFGLYKGVRYISTSNTNKLAELEKKYGKEEAARVLYEMYRAQPCEEDARYWAEKKIKELKEGKLSIYDFLNGIENIIWEDSWEDKCEYNGWDEI